MEGTMECFDYFDLYQGKEKKGEKIQRWELASKKKRLVVWGEKQNLHYKTLLINNKNHTYKKRSWNTKNIYMAQISSIAVGWGE